MDKVLEKAISRAKIGLMQKPDTVFFSVLCMSLNVVIENLGTAATDGETLFIDPDFFMKITPEQRIFVLVHETLHVAYMHMLREDKRNHVLWNAAADYVINLELADRNFHLIEGVLIDRKYAGMSTEQVYKILLEENSPVTPSMPDLRPPPGTGAGGGKSKPNAEIIAKAEAALRGKIARAAMAAELAQQSNSVPPSIKRYLEDLTKPKVNWKVVLQRYLSELQPSNYSWTRPNKKYLPTYLPRLHSKDIGRIDFAIDTSGSITADQFNQFVSEVHAVLRMFKPKEIGVYQFDHVLRGSDIVKNIKDIMTVPFSGGGGTNPQPAIDEFVKNKASALIILTDGHFRHQLVKDPKRPVVWVVYDHPSFKPPFGKAIYYSLNK